jgi:hypothetical protein
MRLAKCTGPLGEFNVKGEKRWDKVQNSKWKKARERLKLSLPAEQVAVWVALDGAQCTTTEDQF